MEYTMKLADTSDPTGKTTTDVVVDVPDGQSAEEAAVEAAANNSRPADGLFYMPVGISRGDS